MHPRKSAEPRLATALPALLASLVLSTLVTGCSLRTYAINMVGDALASGDSVYESDLVRPAAPVDTTGRVVRTDGGGARREVREPGPFLIEACMP